MSVETGHLTAMEAARYLGVSIASVRRWTDNGELPCWRTPGGQRRFEVDALDAWLEKQRAQLGGDDE